jgi:hypothetical protein
MREGRLEAIALSAVALLSGCGDDYYLIVDLYPHLAVDGRDQGSVGAYCDRPYRLPGGCSIPVTSIDSLTSDDPSVAEVTLEPPEYEGDRWAFTVRGLRPGATSVRVKATLDDGSKTDGETVVNVQAIDEIRAGLWCNDPRENAPELVQWGRQQHVGAAAFGHGRQLHGEPSDLVEAEGLDGSTFTAPTRDTTITVRSRYVEDFELVLESFGPERVTGFEVSWSHGSPTVRLGKRFSLDGYALVGGRIPCEMGPVALTTLTPEICLGPDGELEWEREDVGFILPTAVGEGSCRLELRAVGGTQATEVAFDLRLDP